MCVVDIRTYNRKDGHQQRIETTTLCQYSLDGQLCGRVERREGRAQVVKTKPADTAGPSRFTERVISTNDKNGRKIQYRVVNRRRDKTPPTYRQEAFGGRSYSVSPVSPGGYHTVEVQPKAPTPPPAADHPYHPRNQLCPRSDCPMMSGALSIEERSPLPPSSVQNDFIRNTTRTGTNGPRVSIVTPSEMLQDVPILSTPRPRKSNKPSHGRHDSMLDSPRDHTGNASGFRRLAQEAQETRDLQQQQDRLRNDELRRRNAKDQEEARQASLDRKRAEAREKARRDSYFQKQKQAEDAQAEAAYERRVRSEERDKEREVKEAQHQRSFSAEIRITEPRSALPSNSPLTPRTQRRPLVIHHQEQSAGAIATQPRVRDDAPLYNNDIIEREQQRARQNEQRSGMEDPLREDSWRDDGYATREWGVGEGGSKRPRRRQYHEWERRRLE